MKIAVKGAFLATVLTVLGASQGHALFGISAEKAAEQLVEFAQKNPFKADFCRQGNESKSNFRLTYRSFGGVLCKSKTAFTFILAQCRDYTNPEDGDHANFNDSGCAKNGLKALGKTALPSKDEAAEMFSAMMPAKADNLTKKLCKMNIKADGKPRVAKIAERCSKAKIDDV